MLRSFRGPFAPFLFSMVCALLIPGTLRAGGISFVSTQDGDWADPSIWSPAGGPPDRSSGESGWVGHVVTVTTAGNTASDVSVGVSQAGVLNIQGGDLFGGYRIGNNASGEVNLSGGTASGSFTVGELGSGILRVSGGSLDGTTLRVGIFSGSGEFVIQGAGGTIALTNPLNVGDSGTITLVPTANGAAGLSTISVDADVNLTASSSLVLDDSSYSPSVGDAWTLVSTTGTISGSFGSLTAPAGLGLVEEQLEPGEGDPRLIVIRVVASTAVPSLDSWAVGGLVLALSLVGTLGLVSVGRRAKD